MALPFFISPSNPGPLGEAGVNGFAGKDCKLFWSTGVSEYWSVGKRENPKFSWK
jgi:hypothetical protein